VTQTGAPLCGALFSDLRALGPFFAVETHVRGAPVPPPWQPMTQLIDDADVLTARVEAVRIALAHRAGRQPEDVDIRVAASVAHLGLVARLLAPMIGAISLGCAPLSWSVDDLWWQNEMGGPYPLSVAPRPATWGAGPGLAVEAITAAFLERYRVSRHVLWGNIGSAANSAAQLICSARPDLTARAYGTADALLTDSRIDGGAVRAGPRFRRRSCCLIYRIANDRGAACGDCVLR